MTSAETVVLGAGISGLAAARAIEAAGERCLVLERSPTPGGLTRTVQIGDFCFDYTGHFLHLSRYRSPADLPFAGLCDDDWMRVARRSCCYVAGRLITAPIQYHLGELPPAMLAECARAYDARPPLPTTGHPTFRDFIVSGFGQYLADLFLIPQNEKTMATGLDRLSHKAVRRFFPPPDEARVRAGIAGAGPVAAEYNSEFWYPREGGIGILVEGLSRGLGDLRLREEVVEVDLAARTLRTSSGLTVRWRRLLSSMPLRDLCRACTDPWLSEAHRQLTHSSTISLNFGVRGPLPAPLQGVHWIYIPDRSIPFYRVGVYSNISAGTCAPQTNALYVEVGVPSEELVRAELIPRLETEVVTALARLGWLEPSTVVCSAVHVLRCAYVHHTPEREEIIEEITRRLEHHGVRLIGRYGRWDYTSMEDSIDSGLGAARDLA